MIPILVLLTILVFLAIDYFYLARRRPIAPPLRAPSELRLLPAGLFLSPGHTWLQVEPEGTVRLGVDRLPGTLLEHVERVDLGAEGSEVRVGDRVARLRHDGRSIDLHSPIDGRIEAVNADLRGEPGRVRSDPFGGGWLLRMTPQRLAQALRRMTVAEEAEAWMRGELERLREWLTVSPLLARADARTLPDGGLPVAGLVQRLDDEAWQELVHRFFDAPARPSRAAGSR